MTGPGTTEEPADRRLALWIGLALCLGTLIAFEPALDHEFVRFDDTTYVTESPYAETGLSWAGVVNAFRQPYASNWHPLTLISHMVDVELYGLNPRGHHMTSVLLHVANSLLVFLVLHSLTMSRGPRNGSTDGGSTDGGWAACGLAAGLFAVHPLRVESVAWVSERKDVLCAFFVLWTLAAYVCWARRRTAGRYLLVVACFALALLAKPMAVTLPCVLLLLDVWPLGRLGATEVLAWRHAVSRAAGRLVLEKLPLFALSGLGAWSTIVAQNRTLDASAGVPLALRLGNACVSYVRYLGKTFWPTDLAFYYPYPDQLSVPTVVGAAALLVLLTTLAILGWRRSPALLVGWLWFVGMLVPVVGILRAGDQAMADRYTYLPTLGLLVALVWGFRDLAGNRRIRQMGATTAMLVIAVLIPVTRSQVAIWSDSETLFRDALAKTEDNYVAHLNLAETLRADGRLAEAFDHYRAATVAGDEVADTHGALGQALRLSGRPAEAVAPLRRALELSPWDVRALVNLASALAATGGEDEAEALLRRLLAVQPDNLQAQWGLGDLLARRGARDEALRHYRLAARLAPGNRAIRQAIEGLEAEILEAEILEAERREPAVNEP